MKNKRVLNMSGVKKDQGAVEEEREEDRGWGWGGRRWKLDDRKEEWCYLLWECAGFWEVCNFSKLDWIGWSACVLTNFFNFFLEHLITCDVLNSCWESVPNKWWPVEKWVDVMTGMCFGQDKLLWFPHGATAERRCKGEEAKVKRGKTSE